MIKILIIILILSILFFTILIFRQRQAKLKEHFYEKQCSDFYNFQVVIHSLKWEPTIKNKKLLNYVGKDYFEKGIIKVLNDIWYSQKISWNLLNIVEEDIMNNNKTYYDNYSEFNSTDISQSDIKEDEINKYVKNDLAMLLELSDTNDFNKVVDGISKKDVYMFLLTKMINDEHYYDDHFHIILVPYLNGKEFYIMEGLNKKPLILLCLYKLNENNNIVKNINAHIDSKLKGKWLSEFRNNILLLDKFKTIKYELVNGNKNELDELNNKYKIYKQNIQDVIDKYNKKDINKTISEYECLIKQIKELYDKDYMKDTAIIILRKKKPENYRIQIKDKIKELQDIDEKILKKKLAEADEKKIDIDNFNNEKEKYEKELIEIEERLELHYSKKINKEQIKFYGDKINKLSIKTNKIEYNIYKIKTSILLSQIFALFFRVKLDAIITDNYLSKSNSEKMSDRLNKDIMKGGTIIDNKNKENIYDSISKNKYNQFDKDILYKLVDSDITINNHILDRNIDKNILENKKKCEFLDDNSNTKKICSESVKYDNVNIKQISLTEKKDYLDRLKTIKEKCESDDDVGLEEKAICEQIDSKESLEDHINLLLSEQKALEKDSIADSNQTIYNNNNKRVSINFINNGLLHENEYNDYISNVAFIDNYNISGENKLNYNNYKNNVCASGRDNCDYITIGNSLLKKKSKTLLTSQDVSCNIKNFNKNYKINCDNDILNTEKKCIENNCVWDPCHNQCKDYIVDDYINNNNNIYLNGYEKEKYIDTFKDSYL